MKVNPTKRRKEEGMTFAEVMICMVVVALVVGPFCIIFSSANKTRQTAVRIEEATCYGETLLAQIEDQISKDIILMQQIEGNRVLNEAKTEEEKKGEQRYQDYCQKYLKGEALEAKNEKLQAFLQMSEADYKKVYRNDRYTYEVVLWPLSKAPIDKDALEMTKDTIYHSDYKAIRLYSSDEAKYQLDADFYAQKNKPISFSVSEEWLKAFKDSSCKYIISSNPDEKYVLLNALSLKADVDKTSGIIEWNGDINEEWGGEQKKGQLNNGCTEIKDVQYVEKNGKVEEIDLTIGDGEITQRPTLPAGSHYIGVVKVDLTALLRNVPDQINTSSYSNYNKHLVIKCINDTGYDQVVQVIQNQISDDEKLPNIQVIVEDTKGSKGTIGKSYKQTISDVTTEENYIIAVVIRELNPLVGRKGKIIKKMLDLYSYDPTILARR